MEKKIILITLSPKSHRTSEENLGIEYLKAALEKKKHPVELIDAWLCNINPDQIFQKIEKEQSDILMIGFSSYMSNTKPTVELIQRLKKEVPHIPIVCGGFGPTFYPNDHLKIGADYVIRGEGEEAICKLANAIKNGIEPTNIENISYQKNGEIIHNRMAELNDSLDSLPFPARDYLEVIKEHKSTVNMVSARGCSGNCEFCSVVSFFKLAHGKVWRTRSIKNIVDEIEAINKQGITYIKMVDDSFIDGARDEKWCIDFANEIEKRNLEVKLRGQIRADKVTEETLKNLKRAGFFSFACGIENGSESALKRMNKKATLEDNKRALELFQKYNYLVQMGFILFDKETTLEELEENYQFLNTYQFAVTKGIFSEMYSAEGTPLNTRLRDENKLRDSDFINNNNAYEIENRKVKEIYNGLKVWHKSHSEIYDMTIDPLTAPKAIPESDRNLFYQYTMELKKKDLELFKKVLELAKEKRNILSFVEEQIEKSREEYQDISSNVQKVYKKTGLIYNADKNPFI